MVARRGGPCSTGSTEREPEVWRANGQDGNGRATRVRVVGRCDFKENSGAPVTVGNLRTEERQVRGPWAMLRQALQALLAKPASAQTSSLEG